jgi:hypothetical protein
MTDPRSNEDAALLVLRMTLATLRSDNDEFTLVYEDFKTLREAELDADGQSRLLSTLLETFSAITASQILTVDDGDRAQAIRRVENDIKRLRFGDDDEIH